MITIPLTKLSPYWLRTGGPRLGYSPVVVGIPYPNGLAACMARVGMTDPQLADLAETTKQQVHKLRHGQRKLTVQWAKRLASHLGCTWQELIEGPLDPVDALRSELLRAFENMSQRDRERLVEVARNWELAPRKTTGKTHPAQTTRPPAPHSSGRKRRKFT